MAVFWNLKRLKTKGWFGLDTTNLLYCQILEVVEMWLIVSPLDWRLKVTRCGHTESTARLCGSHTASALHHPSITAGGLLALLGRHEF